MEHVTVGGGDVHIAAQRDVSLGEPAGQAGRQGTEELELVLEVPVIEGATVGHVHGHDPHRDRHVDSHRDEARLAIEGRVVELTAGGDVAKRVPAGDGDPVVHPHTDVHDVVALTIEHGHGLRCDVRALRLLQTQGVGLCPFQEPVDSRGAGAQRVEVPRRHPELVRCRTGR
jgi:hypothetical protein